MTLREGPIGGNHSKWLLVWRFMLKIRLTTQTPHLTSANGKLSRKAMTSAGGAKTFHKIIIKTWKTKLIDGTGMVGGAPAVSTDRDEGACGTCISMYL